MKIEWIKIPDGDFRFGLSDSQVQELKRQLSWMAPHGYDHIIYRESPLRIVDLSTFYIARFPITFGQYLEFVEQARPNWDFRFLHETIYAEHPISGVWHHAREFCNWIGARLPTTFEWEKAARGTDGRLYPWGNEWNLNRGNFGQKNRRGVVSGLKTSAVGSYPESASPYGVEDMIGNGFEWTMTFDLNPPEWVKVKHHHSQMIAIRGTAPDPDTTHPWLHRVTHTTVGMLFEGTFPPYTGFRPVMDEWQRQVWQGAQI